VDIPIPPGAVTSDEREVTVLVEVGEQMENVESDRPVVHDELGAACQATRGKDVGTAQRTGEQKRSQPRQTVRRVETNPTTYSVTNSHR
jgi:hypothetical protein